MKGLSFGISLLFSIGTSAAPALATPVQQKQAAWPDLPFDTKGRYIKSASGADITYAGVNWPGAADTMLPEGLQYRSVAGIAEAIKSLGMNAVRLTYAIEMIDDCLDNSPNQSLKNTLVNALGHRNGTAILHNVLKYNPQFTASTTRLEVRIQCWNTFRHSVLCLR